MKQLSIQNVSLLPLQCLLKLEYPFSILLGDADEGSSSSSEISDQHRVTIDVGESFVLTIQFDPRFKRDRFIRTVESKLDISYEDHPSTDWVALRGDVFYPNLKFEVEEVHVIDVSFN